MTNRHEPDPYAPNHELRAEDLKFKAEGARRHRDYIVPDNAVEPALVIAPTRRRHSKKKMKTGMKILLIVLACLLGIVAVAGATILFLQSRGRHTMLPQTPVTIVVPESVETDPQVEIEVTDDGRTVTYNGERYRFNENRTNILCIGVDQNDLGLDNGVVGTGGQADTLVVLSVDTANGHMNALAISRDTIADIDLFAEDGSFVGTEKTQICLSYAYGDGREQSCETTARAVSRLLYGIPINTYMAVDLTTIPAINDAVGGVTVTLLSDFQSRYGPYYSQGETVTLYGEDALWYVRARDTEQLASNNDRMARQKQYLSEFAETVITAAKSDLQLPLRLFETVSDEAITSLTPSKITFLTTSLVRHTQPLQFTSVAGAVVKGDDGYAEFHVDEQALYEQVLNIFYTKE